MDVYASAARHAEQRVAANRSVPITAIVFMVGSAGRVTGAPDGDNRTGRRSTVWHAWTAIPRLEKNRSRLD